MQKYCAKVLSFHACDYFISEEKYEMFSSLCGTTYEMISKYNCAIKSNKNLKTKKLSNVFWFHWIVYCFHSHFFCLENVHFFISWNLLYRCFFCTGLKLINNSSSKAHKTNSLVTFEAINLLQNWKKKKKPQPLILRFTVKLKRHSRWFSSISQHEISCFIPAFSVRILRCRRSVVPAGISYSSVCLWAEKSIF